MENTVCVGELNLVNLTKGTLSRRIQRKTSDTFLFTTCFFGSSHKTLFNHQLYKTFFLVRQLCNVNRAATTGGHQLHDLSARPVCLVYKTAFCHEMSGDN